MSELRRLSAHMPKWKPTPPEELGPTYVQPQGYCPYGQCGGLGWYKLANQNVGDEYFGQALPCQCLKDKQAQTSNARLGELRRNLSATEQGWTFANWIGSDRNALRMAEQSLEVGEGLWTFYGPVGAAKSGLLAAIVNAALARKIPALYKVVPAMLMDWQATFQRGSQESFQEAFNEVANARVLALDEMWRYKNSEWTETTMYTLIDHRYRHFKNLLTLVGTNTEPDTKTGDAVASRLCDSFRGKLIPVTGPDLRPMAGALTQRS